MSYKLISNECVRSNRIDEMFKLEKHISNLINVSSEIRFEDKFYTNNFDIDNDKVQILNKLIDEMKPELFKRLQIKEYKDNSSFVGERVIRAVLNVADIKTSHIRYDKNLYVHKNNKFTVDEINKAIENTYPERFI